MQVDETDFETDSQKPERPLFTEIDRLVHGLALGST